MPLDYRAIGCTGTGDEICIDVYDHVGALFFYDWVGEPWARMYDMSISFDDFLESLFQVDKEVQE